jgi:hypothetical protein
VVGAEKLESKADEARDRRLRDGEEARIAIDESAAEIVTHGERSDAPISSHARIQHIPKMTSEWVEIGASY